MKPHSFLCQPLSQSTIWHSLLRGVLEERVFSSVFLEVGNALLSKHSCNVVASLAHLQYFALWQLVHIFVLLTLTGT